MMLRSFRFLLLALVLAALAVAGFLTMTALNGLGSLAAQADRVYVAKDVTADILPPPMYLIEARLVASQALDGYLEPVDARREIERLAGEYRTRAGYWRKSPPYGLERDLLGAQHESAERLLGILAGDFLARLEAGDRGGARRALDAAQEIYGDHRSGVDTTVKSSTAFASQAAADFEAFRAETRRASLVALGAGIAVLVLLLWLIQRRVGAILGAEPEQLAADAQRLAEGNLGDAVAFRKAGSAAQALEIMRQKLSAMLEEGRRQTEAAQRSAREIEERAAREEAMARDNARIRSALDGAASCVVMTDTSARLVYANGAARALLQKHVLGLSQLAPGLDPQSPMGADLQPLVEATRRAGRITEFAVATGTMRARLDDVRDAQGNALGLVLELTDRTAEAAAEQEIGGLVGSAVQGDLTRRLAVEGKQGFLKDVSVRLNELMDAVDSIVHRVQGAAAEVERRAREVAAGSTDVRQRTEQQAAGLEETAAAVEQLTATVKGNATNAAEASRLATGASSDLERGRSSVQATVEAVGAISDSSRSIGEIISVIDEIAFQTNLLALNAAVEAARAGELGRGFAVVAAEVRTLATRSAEAAREIKSLVAQSSTRVQSGEALVQELGATFGETVAAVHRMASVAAEIADANREQASGVAQIERAVTDIDRTTQETAALMEEANAAAVALLEQADLLAGAVAHFRTRGEDGGSATPRRAAA